MKRIIKYLFSATLYFCISISAKSEIYENEVTVTAPDSVKMGATLTTPDSNTRLRGVIVLATGSGTQNRDEELFGKKPFKTIADHLTPQGFAVLRVDDRGLHNRSESANATMQTYADDVAAAVALADSLYHDAPIGIIGHSAGGAYAVMNGAHNPRVNFIITLAGPAWSGDSIVMAQSRAIATAITGQWAAEEHQRKMLAIAKSPLPTSTARMMMTMQLADFIGKEASAIPNVAAQLQSQINGMLSPWYRSFMRYDPAEDIKSIRIPMLALVGSKDLQVLADNLLTINELNPAVTTKLMDSHNHLFQKCITGLTDEYATLPGDISDETLNVISQWLDSMVP